MPLCRIVKILSFLAAVALIVASPDTYGRKTDSLRTVLASDSIDDTTRVLVLADLAWEHKNHNTNPDSVLYYANKGLSLSQKLNYSRGTAICNLDEGMAYTLQSRYSESLAALKSALTYFEHGPPCKELNETYHNIALTYYLQTKLEDALVYFERSLTVAKDVNSSRLARAHYYLADVHNELGNYTDALQHYLEALSLYENGNKRSAVSNCYTNIATVYAHLKDSAKCEEYVNMSLKMFADVDNPEERYQNYTNIGIVYSVLENYPKALILFEKGLKLTDSLHDSYWNSVFLLNIAEVYTKTGKTDKAIATYNEVLNWNGAIDDVNFTLAAHSGIGRVLFNKGKTREGIAHMQQTFALVKKNKLKRLIMETASELSEMYEKQGDYPNALKYNRIFHSYKDSIYNESNDKKIQQLQFDYELEKKEREIDKLVKNEEIQEVKNQKEAIIEWSLIAGILGLAVIALMQYRSSRSQKETNRKILAQKDEIQKQATKLEELNNFKDKTFSVLSHDLRGPINSITTTIKMLNDKDISEEDYAELTPEINSQLNSLNLLLDNVLLWAKSHMREDIENTPDSVNLYELTQDNIDLLADAAKRKDIKINNNIDKTVNAYCNKGQVDVVMRNLVMNAIKYTNQNGIINIGGRQEGTNVQFSIEDNGVGMSPKQLNELFRVNTDGNTYGTAGEKGAGLGLLLCQEFIESNHGTIEAESEQGVGSKFTVTLPSS